MRLKSHLWTALFCMLSFTACVKFVPTEYPKGIVKGTKLEKSAAVSELTKAQRWCSQVDGPNGMIDTYIFRTDQTGDYAIWDTPAKRFHAMPIQWNFTEDVLTVTRLPEGELMTGGELVKAKLLFSGNTIQFWHLDESGIIAVLESCPFTL